MVRSVLLGLVWLGGALAAGAALLTLYVVVVWIRLPDTNELGTDGDPGPTSFMKTDGCREHSRTYAPLERIDPRLVCTVLWSEDWRFFHHDGIDRRAIKAALKTNWKAREWRYGGSTIPMQLARNLYQTRSRTLSRKIAEMALALRLVDRHDRLRLLEVYINAAEWAPCVYGAEAAAQHYFGHGADRLDWAEATFLGAMLPRPGTPPGNSRKDRAALVRKQGTLLLRMTRMRVVTRAEHKQGRQEVLAGWRDGWNGHAPTTAAPAPQTWYELGCGTTGRIVSR